MFQDTGPEHEGPGWMTRSGLAPLNEGLVPGLDGGRLDLEQVVLEPLGPDSVFLSLVRLASLHNTSQSCLNSEVRQLVRKFVCHVLCLEPVHSVRQCRLYTRQVYNTHAS